MFVLVLAAEADETRQAITSLIVCLVGVAALLSALTVWYWRYTSPKRQAVGLHGPAEIPTGPVGLPAPSSDRAIAPVSIESADTAPDAPAATSADADNTVNGDRARIGAIAATTTVEIGGPPAVPATVSPSATVAPFSTAPPAGDSPEETRIEVPDRSTGRKSSADRIEIADRRRSGSGTERNGRRTATNGTSSGGPRSSTSEESASAPSKSSPSAASSDDVDAVSFHARRPSGQNNGALPPVTVEANGRRYTHHKDDDELSEARRRRDRKNEVLSDEDWAAIMKSAFEQMFP